ncbi:hypothetical protein OQA88_11965 [Cercophora sp. LCS_1]
MFIGVCIAIAFLPIFLELFRLLGKHYDRHIKKKNVGKVIRQNCGQQLVRTIAFAGQLGIAYLLMLLAMSFNEVIKIGGPLTSAMASKSRSSDGCWTCRLRRKKCDEVRPVCGACGSLEIDCLYGDQKPEWMDGGDKQKEKAEWFKLEIKRKGGQRRERKYLQSLEQSLGSLDVVDHHDDSDPGSSSNPQFTPPESSASPESSATRPNGGARSEPSVPPEDHSPHSLLSVLTSSSSSSSSSDNPMDINERELNMITLYLDYVFPFLFPFYRPRLLDSGRGWLLVLFSRNKALLHTALSLASYFFNVVMNHTNDPACGASPCQTHNWDELQRQQNIALTELQTEMQRIVARGVRGYLAETNRVMASIIQLLTFEIAVANTGNWTMHLDAAAELFTLIMTTSADPNNNGQICFTSLLIQLGTRPFCYTPKSHPWSAEQASLRFSTAFLLCFDALAATSLETVPRLQQYHAHLLAEPDHQTRQLLPDSEKEYVLPHINLREFTGIHNWVFIAVGEIASLDAWKKEQKRNGSFSVAQLLARATAIECNLRVNMATLDMMPDTEPTGPQLPLLEALSHMGGLSSPRIAEVTTTTTKIWAQAVLTYLHVVVSGWQPASQEIRSSVAATITMLLGLASPGCLRPLVWPMTITGCMAAPEEEQTFRDLVASMGPLTTLGAMAKALAIMEHVWAHRAEIEANYDKWDYASCFKSLGTVSLLV